jgi:hypothetical protein
MCERVNGLCFRTLDPSPPCASDSMLGVEIWSVVGEIDVQRGVLGYVSLFAY